MKQVNARIVRWRSVPTLLHILGHSYNDFLCNQIWFLSRFFCTCEDSSRRCPWVFGLTGGSNIGGISTTCKYTLLLYNVKEIVEQVKMPVRVVSNPSWAPLQAPAGQIWQLSIGRAWCRCPGALVRSWITEPAEKRMTWRTTANASRAQALRVKIDIDIDAFLAAGGVFCQCCCCCLTSVFLVTHAPLVQATCWCVFFQ